MGCADKESTEMDGVGWRIDRTKTRQSRVKGKRGKLELNKRDQPEHEETE
jgi:hypothetical protein